MRIGILGGGGYLGGRVGLYLAQKGLDVTLFTGKFNNEGLISKNIKLADLTNRDEIIRAFENIDGVINFAGPNSMFCENDLEKANHFRYKSINNAIDSIKKNNLKLFIQISTIHVYSDLTGSINESSGCVNIKDQHTSKYAINNIYAEDLVKTRFDGSFTTYILRISNTFGYPLRIDQSEYQKLFLNSAVRSLVIRNELLKIKSNPAIVKNFTPIESVCESIYRLIGVCTKELQVFNLGTEYSMTLRDAIDCVGNVYSGGKKNIKISTDYIYESKKLIKAIGEIDDYFEKELNELFRYENSHKTS